MDVCADTPDEGKYDRYLCARAHSHIVYWTTNNRILIDAMKELHRENKIEQNGSIPLVYMLDGKVPTLPLVKKKYVRAGYIPKPGELYWCPVVINLHPSVPRRSSEELLKEWEKDTISSLS